MAAKLHVAAYCMTFENPLPESMATQNSKPTSNARLGSNMAISARKLAATLWELQEISLLSSAVPNKALNETLELNPPDNQTGKHSSCQLPFAPSPASAHVTMRALRRSSVKCRIGDNAKRKQPKAATAQMQVLKILENAKSIDCPENEESMHEIEVDNGKTVNKPPFLNEKAVTAGENGGSTTSSELLKVLNRVWALEEQHNSSTSVVSCLKSDLEEARLQVKNLTIQQLSHYRDMEALNKKLSEEKAELQEREQEKTNKAFQSLKEDLEEEKKSKRKLELAHKKVSKELIDTKKSLAKALKDLEREQKARELMEDVCDELAREVGEDKARVEALKRESLKVREEVEEERKMLQVAEVWREERVQMKLAEARLEIEEKNTALDKLRMELDAFLKAKRAYVSTREGAGLTNVDSNPELTKTAEFLLEKQPSSTFGNLIRQNSSSLSNLINEAYKAADDYRGGPDSSSLDAEIKATVSNIDFADGRSSGFSSETSDGEYDDADFEEEEDLHSIELHEDFQVDKDMGEVNGNCVEEINDVDYSRGLNTKEDVDHLIQSPCVEKPMKQGARQGGLEIGQFKAVESIEENKDRVKMWNFELNSSPGGASEAKGELTDRRVSSANTDDVRDINSNPQGDGALPLNVNESKGETLIPKSDRYRKLSTDPPREPPQLLSLEAVTNGVWSLQNLGSTRDLKGVNGMVSSSCMQQCTSPTQKWGHNLSSPELARQQNASSAKPVKAPVVVAGGVRVTTKDKTVKGKTAESKADTKQPRFRICKAL